MPVVVNTLPELIRELHNAFAEDRINVEYINELMHSYKSNRQDWIQYAKFDRLSRYTRNLVDEGNGKFNLMLLCWNEGQGSTIHDHADAHCFMKMLEGDLYEVRFACPNESEPEEGLKPIAESRLGLNEVCYINDSMGLHRVENRSHSNQAVSLHLYCPPFNACSIFDQRTGHKSKCPVTFWSKYGQKTDLITCRSVTSVKDTN